MGQAKRRPSLLRELQRMADDAAKWSRRTAEVAYQAGLQEDGSWVRRLDEGPPYGKAICPNHADTVTRWRGPLADRASAPLLTEERGGMRYEFVAALRPDEPRDDEAARLYGIADKWQDKPRPWSDTYVIWQASPCLTCMDDVREAWLNAMWPPTPSKRARGATGATTDGDWEL